MTKKLFWFLLVLILMAMSYQQGQRSAFLNGGDGLNYTVANAVWAEIQEKYLRADEVDTSKLKYGFAKGLVESIGDQHSTFFDPDEAMAFITSLNGNLEGIGAELKLDEGMVIVVSPLPDSPAETAGLLPGDIIMKVDGENVGFVTDLLEVVMKIRGEIGTKVELTIIHADSSVPENVTIIRDKIELQAVTWTPHEKNGEKIALVELYSFTETIGIEFQNALREVVAAGYDKLIIDMRFNGGGYLDGAVDIVSHFVAPDESVVFIRDQDEELERTASSKTVKYDGDIVVLINEASASASEIVAGALRDHDLAHIIGEKSFGKGSVQELSPFLDNSVLRITVAEWLTPAKNSIEGVGIEPDQVIELDYEAYIDGKDNQLDEALEFLAIQKDEQ